MVNINLLPWREHELEYQKLILYRMFLLVIVLTASIIFAAHIIISQQEAAVRIRIALINQKLNYYHKQSEQVIQPVKLPDVQRQQPLSQKMLSGKLFAESDRMNQAMVCFTDIERMSKTFSFTGKARSMGDLTEFLRQWNTASLFNEMQVKLIEQEKNGLVKFGFQAKEV